MFIILRILALNILKIFLNTIVSIGCVFVQTNKKYKPTESTNTLYLLARKQHEILNKKSKGDVANAQRNRRRIVALTNIDDNNNINDNNISNNNTIFL